MLALLLHRIYVCALIFLTALIFLIAINSLTRYTLINALIRQLYLPVNLLLITTKNNSYSKTVVQKNCRRHGQV